MGDAERIEMFGFRAVRNLGKATVKQFQLKAQVFNKWNCNTKAHAKILLNHSFSRR
jgi:hypothetical protein